MTQHKWHKEIKAWADGAEIEFSYFSENGVDVWREADVPLWNCGEGYIYRIKPQPVEVVATGQPFRVKEKKYLYVINNWGSLRLSEGKTLQSNEFLVAKFEVQDD